MGTRTYRLAIAAIAVPTLAVLALLGLGIARAGDHAPPAKASPAGVERVAEVPPAPPASLTLIGSRRVPSFSAIEGLAVNGSTVVYRGVYQSIPAELRARGWNHVGDPDARAGVVVDAYQGAAGSGSKLFSVTRPGGRRVDYTHPLDRGETRNNSFAAISPDGQWLVSGEWGRERRLLVFAMPDGRAPGRLPLATTIRLAQPVTDVQGCDFVTATRLICSAAGPALVELDLARALDGRPVDATVTRLAALPQRPASAGQFEAEGVDYTAGVLRAEVLPPSPGIAPTVEVYSYRVD